MTNPAKKAAEESRRYWDAYALVDEFTGNVMTCDCDIHVLAITELRQWLQDTARALEGGIDG